MREVTLDSLQGEWPNWKLWRTETLWLATRRRPKYTPPEGFFCARGEFALTLVEDGPRELLSALQNQAVIEESIRAVRAVDHDSEHPVGPACPLKCLALSVRTERVLNAHWLPGERRVSTVGDALMLKESGALKDVSKIGPERIKEIDRRLQELHVGEQT